MKFRVISLLALASLAIPSFASISIRFDNTLMGSSIDYVFQGNGASGFAGQLAFTDLTDNSTFTSFCVDIDHHIGGGQTYDVDCSNTLGDAVYEYSGSVLANSAAAVTNNDSATAMQIAIWASRYGGDLVTNTGGFHLESNWYANNGAIVNQAIGMMNLGASNLMDAQLLMPNPVESGQAQLRTVPEPASMVALGLGILAVARKRRSAKTA